MPILDRDVCQARRGVAVTIRGEELRELWDDAIHVAHPGHIVPLYGSADRECIKIQR